MSFRARPQARRDASLDALRALAVIGMMAAHTARLIPHNARPTWARGVLLFEPLIPSLFLLLVGFSLTRSFDAARAREGREGSEATGAWFARQARRAAGLWAISVLFFVAEHGVRLPDALFTGGILSVIAYSILLVGALLPLPRSGLFIAAVLLAGCAAFAWLDATGRAFYPLGTGSAPFLPMMLFALAGAALGRMKTAGQKSGAGGYPLLATGLTGILGIVIGAWLMARHGVEPLFTKPFGRSVGGRELAAPLFTGGAALHVGFYNLRPVLAAACLGLQLAVWSALSVSMRNIPEKSARFVLALGRHALGIYVLHLAILAVLVTVLGNQPLSAKSGTATWLGLILVGQAAAIFLQNKKQV
jgi:peptidoglycan/LPS O-acetylase OafA/YrhL